jgi:DNA-binding protein HU-beta
MTKADLVARIADESGINKATAERALNSFVNAVTDALAKGEKITLVGFGTFSLVERAQREGRNPRTGEAITIQASKVVKFKAGSKLKDSIGGLAEE